MAGTATKKTISIVIYLLGAFGGLCGCAIYPMAAFTVGANDCWQEVVGLSLIFLSLLPSSLLALRFPRIAGWFMLFVPCFCGYGLIAERSYMIHVRGFPDQGPVWYAIRQALVLGSPYAALGIFSLITSRLRWPVALSRRTGPEE